LDRLPARFTACRAAARTSTSSSIDAASLQRFLVSLPAPEYYADADAALDALRRRGQFNVIDKATAWKADLIVRKARPFSVEEMRRPIEGNLLGARVRIASAEDTLISKMEWAKLGGGSELQLRDARES